MNPFFFSLCASPFSLRDPFFLLAAVARLTHQPEQGHLHSGQSTAMTDSSEDWSETNTRCIHPLAEIDYNTGARRRNRPSMTRMVLQLTRLHRNVYQFRVLSSNMQSLLNVIIMTGMIGGRTRTGRMIRNSPWSSPGTETLLEQHPQEGVGTVPALRMLLTSTVALITMHPECFAIQNHNSMTLMATTLTALVEFLVWTFTTETRAERVATNPDTATFINIVTDRIVDYVDQTEQNIVQTTERYQATRQRYVTRTHSRPPSPEHMRILFDLGLF